MQFSIARILVTCMAYITLDYIADEDPDAYAYT